LLDAVFSLTLFLRGRVTRAWSSAALDVYRHQLADERVHPYYGRIVRQDGWTVLQYWVFYPFNNWRSGFYGANDHEADWETVAIYLSTAPDGQLVPAWVAYAAHDYVGDDLRRAWDDTEQLNRVGNHPVVYIGAGSHAAYFQRGDYIAQIEVPFPDRLAVPLRRLASFWFRLLRGAGLVESMPRLDSFRIPFVDYARGDGRKIGPGQEDVWQPVVIDPPPTWVSRYRGLWGYYARDPAAGENAPSGPMYNGNGSVRRAWYDPVGWAGLDDVPPPHREAAVVQAAIVKLEERQRDLGEAIEQGSVGLEALGAEIAAVRLVSHLQWRLTSLEREIEAARAEAHERRRERAQNELVIEALKNRLEALKGRDPQAVTLKDDRRAHIGRIVLPTSPDELRLPRFLQVWAAVSIGLLLLGFGLVAWFRHERLLLVAPLAVVVIVTVESVLRREVGRVVCAISVMLAIVSLAVVAAHVVVAYPWALVTAALILAGGYLTWEKLSELAGPE
jgi:hypothetical protein